MATHGNRALLITGVPGVGKTTIVQTVAAALSGVQIGGFVTGEIRRAGHRVGFELSTFTGHKRVLAHVDLVSPHRVGRYGVDVAMLDEIAEETLALDEGTGVYLVDEIGKMECLSIKFCDAMRRLLDSRRPIVATVALRGSGFIAEVKNHVGVEIWEVTRKNRSAMAPEIVRWLELSQHEEMLEK